MYSILIVDDNAYDRECIKKLVNWTDLDIYVCDTASNGTEGYLKAAKIKPDFVLADVAMPVMDGLEMTEKIRTELPGTKFIFMSCHDEFEFAKAAINLEVSAYVLKPVDLDELTQAIKKVTAMKIQETDMHEYQEKLRIQIRESRPILQENMIRDLLHGRIDSKGEIADRLGYLEMPFKRSYIIILIQIDNYPLNFSDGPIEQKYVTIYSIRNIVKESLLKNPDGYLVIQDYTNLCVIVSGDWSCREETLEILMDQCTSFMEQIYKTMNLTVTIGISNLSSDLNGMPKMYREAEDAVKSKFYSQGNRIILASEPVDSGDSPEIDFVKLKKDIEFLIDSGTGSNVDKMLDRYYSRDTHYSEGYIKSLCYSILTALQMQLSENNESFGNVFGDDYIVWKKLSKFETIMDIKQWILNVIIAVREHMEINQSGRNSNIAQDIKDIIDREYAEIQNIQQIAVQLYISSGYANYIFKQKTGLTIGDYLFEKRMEAAKKLLQDPYIKIYEVAEKVGYVSKSYFGAAFREYTGLAPREYRDKYCK